jgi:large subunit ribosomal protein L22
LSNRKLREARLDASVSVGDLASKVARTGLDEDKAHAAIKNWERGLMRPQPSRADIDALASGLGVGREDLLVWTASHRYAPMAPRKLRLIAGLVRGRRLQDALDVLKFTHQRGARMFEGVLRSALANADEQEADVERLYVSETAVNEAGIRQGTKRWRPKDRGRTVPVTRLCSHILVSLDTE